MDMTLNIAPGTVLILVLGLLVILAGLGGAARIIGQDAARSVIEEYDWDSEDDDDDDLVNEITRLTSDNKQLRESLDASLEANRMFVDRIKNDIATARVTPVPPLGYTGTTDEEPSRQFCNVHSDVLLDANGHCPFFDDAANSGAYHE